VRMQCDAEQGKTDLAREGGLFVIQCTRGKALSLSDASDMSQTMHYTICFPPLIGAGRA
jgi:hypothetical protein